MKAIFFNEPAEEYFLGHQFAEVYKEQVYAPFLVGRKDMTIVDIGANIGVTAFYLSHYAEKLVAVEPSKEHFELLSKMVEFNELKQIIPVNKAIYIKPGKFPLFHPKLGNKTMYTLHTALGMEESEEVEAITIEELFKSQGLTHVDMLKMDIEGTEVEVFSSDTALMFLVNIPSIGKNGSGNVFSANINRLRSLKLALIS